MVGSRIFLTKIVWFLGKTSYIYPRYQVWEVMVMDLYLEFRIFHWITTPSSSQVKVGSVFQALEYKVIVSHHVETLKGMLKTN